MRRGARRGVAVEVADGDGGDEIDGKGACRDLRLMTSFILLFSFVSSVCRFTKVEEGEEGANNDMTNGWNVEN